MARRRTKRKTRRTPKKTNLLNLAQSVVIGNAVTHGLFDTNMYEFVTGRIGGAYTPGAKGESNKITLPELLGAGMGTKEEVVTGQSPYQSGGSKYVVRTTTGYGGVVTPATLGSVVQDNLRNNGMQMATTLIVAPIAFKVMSKLTAKPRREFNKLARMVGMPVSI